MTLKRTLQSICLLTVHPNTTTSVILQVRLPPLHSAMPCDCIACLLAMVLGCQKRCVALSIVLLSDVSHFAHLMTAYVRLFQKENQSCECAMGLVVGTANRMSCQTQNIYN
jgi:hypothetical protein